MVGNTRARVELIRQVQEIRATNQPARAKKQKTARKLDIAEFKAAAEEKKAAAAAKEKRAGKSVVTAAKTDSSEEEQAPPLKRAIDKGKAIAVDPISLPRRKRAERGTAAQKGASRSNPSSPIYAPPRYYFNQRTGALPLREAHDYIGKLQRWNKAQDRACYKLKAKYKELNKTMKKQAEASTQFMKKVAELLVKGGVAGCKSQDFVLGLGETSAPQPHPYIPPSLSDNESPSLTTTDEEVGNVPIVDEEAKGGGGDVEEDVEEQDGMGEEEGDDTTNAATASDS